MTTYPECDHSECTNSAYWVHEGDFRCTYHVEIHPDRKQYRDIDGSGTHEELIGNGEEQLTYPYAND